MTKKSLPLPKNGVIQTTLPDLRHWFHRTEPFLTIDTETTGQHFHKSEIPGCHPARPWLITCHAYATNGKLTPHMFQAHVYPSTREVVWPGVELTRFLKLLRSHGPTRSRPRPYVFHNSIFDQQALSSIGIYIDPEHVEDTLPASHVMDSAEPHGLKSLAMRYCDILDTDERLLAAEMAEIAIRAKEDGFPLADHYKANLFLLTHYNSQRALDYAQGDSYRTAWLWLLYSHILTKQRHGGCEKTGEVRHYLRERRIAGTTYRMMGNPIHLRQPVTSETLVAHQLDCSLREKTCWKLSGREGNLRSPIYLSEVLHEHFQLPILSRTNKTKRPSLTAHTLTALESIATGEAYDFLTQLLEYRDYAYAVSIIQGYIERAVHINGRSWLYSSFNPWATITTRFSASDPNLQSVRKDNDIPVRVCFGPPPGWRWYSFDYNQLELRLMAHASGDLALLDILEHDGDQHQRTADAISLVRAHYGLPPVTRHTGKAVNFAWQYGAGAKKLAVMTGLPVESAGQVAQAMQASYPGVVEFMSKMMREARRHGFVRTLFGYPLHLRPTVNPYTGEMEQAEHVATNYVIQGSAGDICKNSMIVIEDYLRLEGISPSEAHLLMTIHDEIVLECRRNFSIRYIRNIAKLLSAAGDPIGCPTPVQTSSISTHWGDPQPL